MFSHYVSALLAVSGTILLAMKSYQLGDPGFYIAAFLIYGITVFLMFASSSTYHQVNVSESKEEIFRLLDHMMIYVVIAGTYTPICAIVLEGEWRVWMLAGIWGAAIAGVIKKVFWMNAPRWISTILYLIMGWVSVIIVPQIWNSLHHAFTWWIITGGLFYTIGAIIYIIEKPDPFPEVFGHHEIWHLFVMGGAFSHFWGIYQYLPGY